MENLNRTCVVCQTKYHYCGNCSDTHNPKETWRNIYCSENCMNIFDVLSAHAFGHITDAEANKKLKELDISKVKDFRNDFKKQINDIQSAKSKTVKEKDKEIVKEDSNK